MDALRNGTEGCGPRNARALRAAAVVLALFAVPPALAPAAEPQAKPAAAPLMIEGHSIAMLSLTDRTGRRHSFWNPQETVALPPGEYAVAAVQLQGGMGSVSPERESWFAHSAEAPARLIAGAPLTAKVTTTRSGRAINLRYILVDAADRRYGGRSRLLATPRVEIFAQDRRLASGSFSYG